MTILVAESSGDYELIDSGEGEKLERFGEIILARPDPEVLWNKSKNTELWATAHARFTHGERGTKWHIKKNFAQKWVCKIGSLQLLLKVGNNKHVGVFPEQIPQWQWMSDLIRKRSATTDNKNPIKVLNLFGYTGGATMALAQAGAEVTHVDASKAAITWAHENKGHNPASAVIRFMLDDVRKFVERDIKRGVTYDAILMDPPVYGKGAKKEKWHIEENFIPLLERSMQLLSKDPLFVVVTGYASEYSHLSYANALSGVLPKVKIESGELALKESSTGRLLPAGIFARAAF